jgi:F-type H+-transporting ATPase subunit epsilon
MSDKRFKFTVVTPDKCLYKDEPVVAVGAFGALGAFTALPDHEPFLTDLKPGEAWCRKPNGEDFRFFVGGGFCEVLPGAVTILADSAEFLEDIDQERAEKSRQQASERLEAAKQGARALAEETIAGLTPEEKERIKKERIDIFKAEASLAKATARVKAARSRSKFQTKPK